ncbi:RrF2 family transcriptional regulator [Azospirillum halopraeferens]|uniref:RrF2 family transcriptional regulator n=1 Tax=Azospirillum halopraeferens TaxID=34010 RepID=UPI0003FADF26|nr:Rrf2 family transcriptional regulator [Azospirillum halopraeferens]
MRLSTYTDYALRLLMCLALRPDELMTIQDVADRYAISKSHLMKVAHHLSLAGFVHSVRGRNGGLRLGRPAEHIRLGDVVRLTEEDLSVVECMAGPDADRVCPLIPACVLKVALREALEGFLAVLDTYTLADVVKPRNTLARLLDLPAPGAEVRGAGPPA